MAHQNYYKSSAASCPAPMTRAALIALRDANGLTKDCDYVVTDHVQGRVVAGTLIHLQAVNANTLSDNVQVDTTYDTTAWRGLYDIDTGVIYELQDNQNNVARGPLGSEVSEFDWGNPNCTRCTVEFSTWTRTYGATHNVNMVYLSNSALDTTGATGTVDDLRLDSASFLNIAGSTCRWSRNKLTNASGITAPNLVQTVAVSNNELDATSAQFGAMDGILTFTNNTLKQCNIRIAGTAAATMTSNDCNNMTLFREATFGLLTFLNNFVPRRAFINLITGGTYNARFSTINTGMALQFGGSLAIIEAVLETGTTLNNQGTGLIQVTRTHMLGQSASINIDQGSTVNALASESIINNSTMRIIGAVTAGALSINSTILTGGSFVYKRTAGSVAVGESTVGGASIIDGQSGDRSILISRSNLNAARITSTGTGGGIDGVEECDITTQGQILFNATGAGVAILRRNEVRGLSGIIQFIGLNPANIEIRDSRADNGLIRINTVSVSLSHSNLTSTNGSSIILQNTTAAKAMGNIVAENGAIVTVTGTANGSVSQLIVLNGATYACSGAAISAARVIVNGGTLNHIGGAMTSLRKEGTGTLTVGFNTDACTYDSSNTQAMTAVNNNRHRDNFNNNII